MINYSGRQASAAARRTVVARGVRTTTPLNPGECPLSILNQGVKMVLHSPPAVDSLINVRMLYAQQKCNCNSYVT